MGKRLNPYSVKSRHWLALTFAAALCMALLLFVPFIVYNNGIFFYFGDFNVQEIPFEPPDRPRYRHPRELQLLSDGQSVLLADYPVPE